MDGKGVYPDGVEEVMAKVAYRGGDAEQGKNEEASTQLSSDEAR